MGSYNAYKETRINLDPASQGSTISIRLPQHGASTFSSRSQKRFEDPEYSVAEDESAFRQRYLATAASIHHRKHHRTPKSFLWRILEDGKVLSIRAVDISKQSGATDSNLILRLHFPHAIKPGCIAFSDSKEHDVLSAFVLTEDNSLFTLSLRPDHFRKPASTEDSTDWYKSYLSGQFGFKKAFRLVALRADELLLSYTNGELTRLARNSGGDGSVWTESHYREHQWHALTSYFKGGARVSYGKETLELPAATSIASPSAEIDGVPHAFTVSVDHQLRIWNLTTGRVAYVGDLLDQELNVAEVGKKTIEPSHSQLIKVLENDDNVICVTYSPIGTGEFKFWTVSPSQDGNLRVSDIFFHSELRTKGPTSDMWTLADFSVLQQPGINNFRLWVLWKFDTTYQVRKLDLEAGSIQQFRETWDNGWVTVATETIRDQPIPSEYSGDASDATDKWLNFILTPGKFAPATIETGLAIYERGLGQSQELFRRPDPIAQRLCSIIASTVQLGRTSGSNMDFEQFRSATNSQWKRFNFLLKELDKQRGEALSLVVGSREEMPLVVLADGIAAVRDCSKLERIWHNLAAVQPGSEYVATLISSAALLSSSFKPDFLHSCRTLLLGELFEDSTLVGPVRMRVFYEKCDLGRQLGDDEYDALVARLGGGFKDVTPQVYVALLSLMSASQDVDKHPQLHPLAEYGNKLIVKGVQETIELQRKICLDQLMLLIFIEAEINHGELGIGFETAEIFEQLLDMLKRLEYVNWLSNTQITLPISRTGRSNSITENAMTPNKKAAPSTETITILEGVFRHLYALDTRKNESMSSVLTGVITQICAPESEYEAYPHVTQCFLLKNDRPDLAMEFSKFMANDPFSNYVQGRACLAVNDVLMASMLFKKAAFGIGFPDPRKRSDYRTNGYLDETEKVLLNAGMPQYHSHIVNLFDKTKNYSLVIDFARLSLQFIKLGTQEGALCQLRTDMHSRLFNAAIQTKRYEIAHSVLILFTDAALRQSSLRTLVTSMCESSYAGELIALPFIGLQDAVDEILAQKSQSIVELSVGVPYHKILYAWRMKRNDFRGAASVSLERLQKLQQAGQGEVSHGEVGLDTPITRQYVELINVLSIVDPKQAWVFSEEPAPKPTRGGPKAAPKRKVVTLDDIRKAYQEELDRIAAIENNQFEFAGGDAMDVL